MAYQAVRQNELFLAQDWQSVYKAFTSVNFKSYDFATIKSSMVNYIQIHYPEDFTDWSNSSEFIFIIDLLATLGETLSYRIDLNARDNFLDTATRKESILRLAKMLSYQPKRNQSSRGLVKISGIKTSQPIIDSYGSDISNRTIWWNDKTNTNWYEQFLLILNKAFKASSQFGSETVKKITPTGSSELSLYEFNSTIRDQVAIQFAATINGDTMAFEIVNPDFDNINGIIIEKHPNIENNKGILYRNDGSGFSSSNTGFFLPFKQGILKYEDYQINIPLENRVVALNGININETDVWVQEVNLDGSLIKNWTKVASTDTLVYNNINRQIKEIFSVNTLDNDKVEIVFSDGRFGKVPTGMFRIWYRESNAQVYTIKPYEIYNIPINIGYFDSSSKTTSPFYIQLFFSLQNEISNSSTSESLENIKKNAPRVYYTQNRMVNGEDYNSFPLTVGPSVVKIKSVNRTYSGHSPFIDINDPTKQYSNTIEFGDDGVLYTDNYISQLYETYPTSKSYSEIIQNDIAVLLADKDLTNFFYKSIPRFPIEPLTIFWFSEKNSSESSSGYFSNVIYGEDPIKISDSIGNIKYISEGALAELTDGINSIWVKIQSLNFAYKIFSNMKKEYSSIVIDHNINSNWYIKNIIPSFRNILTIDEISNLTDELINHRNFGLRYDYNHNQYKIIKGLDISNAEFSYNYSGDSSSQNLDSSWLIRSNFTQSGWTFSAKYSRYVFESQLTSRFFFDSYFKSMDVIKNKANYDTIKILKYNTLPNSNYPIGKDYDFTISKSIRYSDGFIDPRRVQISLIDRDQEGTIDNPEEFVEVVGNNIIHQKHLIDNEGYYYWKYTDKVSGELNVDWNKYEAKFDGIAYYDQYNNILTNYRYFIGRDKLNYSFKHFAPSDTRIDPSPSNIIDTYILTSGYYQKVLEWKLNPNKGIFPIEPTNNELKNEYMELEKSKMITDQLIWNSAKFKLLFGNNAVNELRANFKVVKSLASNLTDNEIKQKVIKAIDNFLNVNNFDFGETFYYTELSSYIHFQLINQISSVVIVPVNIDSKFGELFQVRCASNELFLSTATVDNVIIIPSMTLSNIRAT